MRQRWLFTGLLVIMLALVAACDTGDNDDNDDDLDTGDVTEAVGDVGDDATQEEEATEPEIAEGTATADMGMATGTEDEDGATGTEEGAGMTEEEDGDATAEDEGDATGTEDDDATTGTEADDGTATDEEDGTATEEDADATESDAGEDATGTEEEEDDGTATEAGGDTTGIGEPIEVGDAVLTVEGAAVLDDTVIGEFGEILGLEEGNQFLGVTMTIENAGSEPLALTEILGRMHLEDGDGEEYDVDLGATALALLSGEFENISQIDAGEEVPVVVGFQTPEDIQPEDLTLVIEPDDATADPITIPLGEGSS